MAYYNRKKAKKQYSVKEKETHYNGLLADKDKFAKKTTQSLSDLNRVSFAAGYNQAVSDCRSALKKKK